MGYVIIGERIDGENYFVIFHLEASKRLSPPPPTASLCDEVKYRFWELNQRLFFVTRSAPNTPPPPSSSLFRHTLWPTRALVIQTPFYPHLVTHTPLVINPPPPTCAPYSSDLHIQGSLWYFLFFIDFAFPPLSIIVEVNLICQSWNVRMWTGQFQTFPWWLKTPEEQTWSNRLMSLGVEVGGRGCGGSIIPREKEARWLFITLNCSS